MKKLYYRNEKIQKCSNFWGNYFEVRDNNIILNSIRIYGSEIKGDYYQIYSEELPYVITSDESSKKIKIIPNSTYSSYMIYYDYVEEKYSKLKRNSNCNSITSERRFFTGKYFDIEGDILLNSIKMFECSQVECITMRANLVPYVIISNEFSNKVRIVPYSDCKNYMIFDKYVDQ